MRNGANFSRNRTRGFIVGRSLWSRERIGWQAKAPAPQERKAPRGSPTDDKNRSSVPPAPRSLVAACRCCGADNLACSRLAGGFSGAGERFRSRSEERRVGEE